MSVKYKALIVVFFILVIDQVTKILVKTNMTLGESIPVFGHWFYIRFIENPGMAFGIDMPGKWGKPMLSIFRIVAVLGIGYYIFSLSKKNAPSGLVICLSMILAGALGNIVDSTFYGLIFNESTYSQIAEFTPASGGYASLLHGQVVDMLYFPLFDGHFPNWLPFWGGKQFVFFRPIFNLADSSITLGVIIILIFQKKFFRNL